ncbi:MAG: PAS domain-containing sensor histidine kinase, partial [Ignavibacteriaceae bacterium]
IPQSLIDSGDDNVLLDFILDQLVNPEDFISKVKKLYNSTEEDLDMLLFKDGRIFERYSAPLIMSDTSIGRVWSFRDITEHKHAEGSLQKERLLLRTVIDNIPDSIYCKDIAGRKTLANVTELSYSGVKTEKEILGKTDFDFYPKELAEGFFSDDQLVIQSGQPILNREEYLLDEKGEKQWLLTSKIPLKDEKGIILGLVGIGRNITARKCAELIIQQQNNQLLELNATKDKFFSIIAHDLRSPFQGFLAMTEMMTENIDEFSPEELVKFITEMNQSAQNLYKLLQNLLDWAQLKKGSFSFTPEEFSLSKIVSENSEQINKRAIQKGITIINEVPQEQKVFADERMTNSILGNLLSNAVKFTRKEGTVTIKAKTISNGMVEIAVQDTGVGISERVVNKLFKIDEKVGSKGTEGELSTGLGLLLCKEFVEKHGGKIWVESEEGKGSSFYFTISKGEGSNL